MKTTHHIVYSTKGGCGKTVFSLLLAHCEHDFNDLQKITINPENYDEVLAKDLLNGNASSDLIGSGNQPRKINCFIDLDFLSSSLTYYLGNESVFDNSIEKGSITLQSLIEKKNYPNELKFVSCCAKGKKSLFIIPVDARQTQKEIFYVKRNNTPLLRYEEVTIFIEYIQKSLEVYLLSKGLNDKDDELNFIYDLPLNSDGYTEAVLDEIFKLEENDKKGKEEQVKVRLYLVANCSPMMKCNLDWFASFINTFREKKCEVVIVCNNNLGCFEYKERGRRIQGGVKDAVKYSVNDVIDKFQCGSTLRDYIKYVAYIDKDVISLKESNGNQLEFKASNIEIYNL